MLCPPTVFSQAHALQFIGPGNVCVALSQSAILLKDIPRITASDLLKTF